MSIAGIAASGLSQLSNIQRYYQQVRGKFSQLGQDLKAGNMSQAQTDFASLSGSLAVQFGSNSPVSRALNTVGQTLHANLLARPTSVSAANTSSTSRGSSTQSFSQMLNQLGQALQSGNLSAAQQAYSAAQQIWQEGPGGASGSPTAMGRITL